MSQGALGSAVGVSFQQIQKYESGKNRISAGRLQQIADVLQLPASYFFQDKPNAPGKAHQQPTAAARLFDSAEGRRLARAFTRIKDKQVRWHIVNLVASLVHE